MSRLFTAPRVVLALVLAAVAGVGAVISRPTSALEATAPSTQQPADAAVERTRRQVKMLDDLYKTAIVFMTNTYVEDEGDVAAGEIARDLFKAMREKGWHDARLIDGTGEPINDENVPGEGFERQAMDKILAGETYVEQVTKEEGKSYLRAATLVPAVNQKCVLCHPGHKVGDVLGAVSYKLPIE